MGNASSSPAPPPPTPQPQPPIFYPMPVPNPYLQSPAPLADPMIMALLQLIISRMIQQSNSRNSQMYGMSYNAYSNSNSNTRNPMWSLGDGVAYAHGSCPNSNSNSKARSNVECLSMPPPISNGYNSNTGNLDDGVAYAHGSSPYSNSNSKARSNVEFSMPPPISYGYNSNNPNQQMLKEGKPPSNLSDLKVPPEYKQQLQNPEALIKSLNVDVPPEFMPHITAALTQLSH